MYGNSPIAARVRMYCADVDLYGSKTIRIWHSSPGVGSAKKARALTRQLQMSLAALRQAERRKADERASALKEARIQTTEFEDILLNVVYHVDHVELTFSRDDALDAMFSEGDERPEHALSTATEQKPASALDLDDLGV